MRFGYDKTHFPAGMISVEIKVQWGSCVNIGQITKKPNLSNNPEKEVNINSENVLPWYLSNLCNFWRYVSCWWALMVWRLFVFDLTTMIVSEVLNQIHIMTGWRPRRDARFYVDVNIIALLSYRVLCIIVHQWRCIHMEMCLEWRNNLCSATTCVFVPPWYAAH